MKSSCCGKYLHRSDQKPVVVKICGKYYSAVEDKDPLVASWKCQECGKVYTQRKRQKGVK